MGNEARISSGLTRIDNLLREASGNRDSKIQGDRLQAAIDCRIVGEEVFHDVFGVWHFQRETRP